MYLQMMSMLLGYHKMREASSKSPEPQDEEIIRITALRKWMAFAVFRPGPSRPGRNRPSPWNNGNGAGRSRPWRWEQRVRAESGRSKTHDRDHREPDGHQLAEVSTARRSGAACTDILSSGMNPFSTRKSTISQALSSAVIVTVLMVSSGEVGGS